VKVLTNIRFYGLAGIAQYLGHLIRHNETAEDGVMICGIDISHPDRPSAAPNLELLSMQRFELILKESAYPAIEERIKSVASLEALREAYAPLVETYHAAILEAKPDVIVINGTYLLPWCLLIAARRYAKAKIVVHYHGILKKEVAHWKEESAKALFLEMERDFDIADASYIFPSELAKRTVEQEVFGHGIEHALVLPNPVPDHFFESTAPRERASATQVGVVSRWTSVKGVAFLESLARRAHESGRYTFNVISNLEEGSERYEELSPYMRLHTAVDNSDLPSFYRSQGIILTPSRFETYGNVPQEALAAGTPVLVSSSSGVAETLRKLGLEQYIDDFSSVDAVLARIDAIAGTSVPDHARATLRKEYTAASIFKRYFAYLAQP